MQPRGLTVCQVARLCDLTCQEVVDLLFDRVEMTPERAVALADGLDTTAEFWLSLSAAWDRSVPDVLGAKVTELQTEGISASRSRGKPPT